MKNLKLILICTLFVIGCDETDELDNIVDVDGGDECESDNNLLNGTFQFTDFVMFDGETCDGEGATGICPADESVTDENACEAICMNTYTYEVIEASDQMECETSGGMWYGWMSYLDTLASEDGTNPFIIISDDGSFTNPDCGLGTYSIDSTGTNITIYETECEDQDGNEFDDILTEADCDSIGGDWDVEMIYGTYDDCEMTIEFSDSAGCYDCDGCNDDGSDSVGSDECDAVTTMEECDNLCGYWEEAYCQRMVLTYDPNHDGICIEPDDDECEFDEDCEDGQICDDGECVYYEDGGDECESDEDCEDGQICDDGECIYYEIDDIPLSEDGMIEGSFQFTGVTIYENVECSGTAITSICDTGDGDIGEISEAQCDSLGGSMLPLINLFTNGDPTCAPYVIFGSDGTFINPECETHSYTIDSTYAVQIDESECEDQDGNDIENISSQAECDSIGGNWDPSLLDGILNIVDSSVIVNDSDQGGCDNDEYVNENDCNEAGYDWENPECLQFTLTYAPDHDGTCTGEDLCDDGSDECESDDDCMFSESYNDENSNGQYDEGESFNDENGNGQYDYGEECIDGECIGQSSIMFFGKKVNVK